MSEMEPKTDHPFKPGARVAITNGWDAWREGVVDKVYKTGRFTLIGSDTQWKPQSPWSCGKSWRAIQSNGRWLHTYLRLWDAATDAEIKEIFAKQRRRIRHRMLVGRLQDSEVTDAMLDQIEAVLPVPKSDTPA